MSERLIEKLDRLAVEAGIPEITPEMRQFAMLVRQDVVASWPKREWVGLTDEEIQELHYQVKVKGMGVYRTEDIYRAVEAKLKEKNT